MRISMTLCLVAVAAFAPPASATPPARPNVLFSNAHCAAPSCTPSRVAMMAGVAPSFGGDYEKSIEILITP
jgi:arylsulfatase A-like enzyme